MNSWILLLILVVLALQAYQWQRSSTSSTSSTSVPSVAPSRPSVTPSTSSTSSTPSTSAVPSVAPSAVEPSVSIPESISSLIPETTQVFRFESVSEPKRILELNPAAQKVILDGIEGALLYSIMTDNNSITFYLFANGTLYEFKYQTDTRIGFLIHHQMDFDSICVYRLI